MTEQIPEDAKQAELVLWSVMTAKDLEIAALNTGAIRFSKHGNVQVISADDLYELLRQREREEQVSEAVAIWVPVRGLCLTEEGRYLVNSPEKVRLYLSPPQPQSVRETLEMAAEILEDRYRNDISRVRNPLVALEARSCSITVRNLIQPLSKDEQ